MSRYVMTAARKRALRKAQLVSARKRSRMRKVGKVLDTHKYAIGMAVAGIAVGSGVYGAMYVSNKRARRVKREDVHKKMLERRKAGAVRSTRGSRSPINDRFEWREGGTTSGAPPQVVRPANFRGKIKVYTSSQNPTVLAILNELNNQPSGRNPKRKYTVQRDNRVLPPIDPEVAARRGRLPGLEPRN